MPNYSFKRPPSGNVDYKVVFDGDKYTFFSDNSGAKSKAMGSIVNYKVAKSILSQSVGWSNISEFDYETKKVSVKDSSIKDAPSFIFGLGAEITYWHYDPNGDGEGTYFATYINKKKAQFFSETLNVSERRQEYNILRNEDEFYVNQLIPFLKESGAKSFGNWWSGEYNEIRERAYTYSWTESVGEELPVAKG